MARVIPSIASHVRPHVHRLKPVGASAAVDYPTTLIGAGLIALWRPDAGQVTTVSGGVTSLVDQSGSGNTATQPGVATARPTLTTRLGQPAMSFDGGDRLQIAGPVLSSNNNWSMVLSYECSSLTAARCLLGLATTGGAAYVLNDTGATKRNIRTQGVGDVSDGDAVTAPETAIVSREAGSFRLYLSTSGPAGEALDVPALAIGTPSGGSAIGSLFSSGTFPFIGVLPGYLPLGGSFAVTWEARLATSIPAAIPPEGCTLEDIGPEWDPPPPDDFAVPAKGDLSDAARTSLPKALGSGTRKALETVKKTRRARPAKR